MALLNRPLTNDEIKSFLNSPSFRDPWIFGTMFEPKHQFVTYRARLDRVDYEQRDTFYQIGPYKTKREAVERLREHEEREQSE